MQRNDSSFKLLPNKKADVIRLLFELQVEGLFL